jgi:tetratricopeptide (TPR) repeat protein
MLKQQSLFKRNTVVYSVVLLLTAIACTSVTQIPATPTASDHTPNTPAFETPTPGTKAFVPGDPTATPLGSDITDPNFVQGVAAYDAKNYEETIALMNAVIQSNPDLAPPYRYRGLSFWYLEDCQSALSDFERALSIIPEYAAAWAGRGLAHSCFEDWDQALEDYEKALSIDPSLAFVHHNLGGYYYGLGDYEKSVEEHSLSVSIDPNRSRTWTARAEALTKLGQYGECIISTTRALEINAEEWFAYTDRAFCNAMLENHAAAIEDYKIFLAHDDTNVQTWYNLGYSQYHSGMNEESVMSYSRTLELDPSYYQANINRGLAYVGLEKYEEALTDFNRALGYGDIPFARSGRGDAYYGLKMYDKAIADYEAAISMLQGSISSAHSYCMVALNYYEVGRYQDALNAAKTGYDLNPACGGQRVLEIQARSYYALGDYEQAILYMNRTFQMGEYALGYYYRGIIYHDAGKYDEALADLNTFISLVPDKTTFAEEMADAQIRVAELMP